MRISFGTDGWRGIIDKDFTYDNLSIVIQGIADYYNNDNNIDEIEKVVYIGYDTRQNSMKYAEKTAEILMNNDIKAVLATRPITTPMLSFAVKKNQGIGGIMITASHNPPEFNGVKIKGPYGGSATPEIINKIEKNLYNTKPRVGKVEMIETFNPFPEYVDHLKSIVNFEDISKYKGHIIIDSMYGAASEYMLKILSTLGLNVTEIHQAPNTSFGGINPEPIEVNLKELKSLLIATVSGLGLALDGDGDRFGLIDDKGRYINSHQIYTILLKYIIEMKGWSGGIVKTFSTTDIISKIAMKYSLPLYETPIGFKYICDLFLNKNILMGGEESGGFGFKNHLPERDGILTGLLILESLTQGNISEQLEEINKEYGEFYYNRLDIKVPLSIIKDKFTKLKSNSPVKIGDFKVIKVESLDGMKFRFQNSWLLLRPSGTEPLVRIYAEGKNQEVVKHLCELGKEIFNN